MTSEEFQKYWKKREAAKDSKYGAIPTQTADGQKFRSHLEATYYNRLKLLMGKGEVLKVEREVRFELIVNGQLITTYVCDFIVHWADGRIEHIDTKSQPTLTVVYKMKKALMYAVHNILLIEVYK